jgi:hypothetical protein
VTRKVNLDFEIIIELTSIITASLAAGTAIVTTTLETNDLVGDLRDVCENVRSLYRRLRLTRQTNDRLRQHIDANPVVLSEGKANAWARLLPSAREYLNWFVSMSTLQKECHQKSFAEKGTHVARIG